MNRRMVYVCVVALGSVCLSLALLEGGIRLVAPQPTKVSVPTILDPDMIYRLPANARGTDVKEEFAVKIETNSLGLRDRDYAREKPHGVISRMLVMGDSMTFAEGVEAEETYPKLLEQLLARRAGPGKYEVINAAIRGYGTDQELVLFQKLLPVFRPDVVVLAFFAGNDFTDNLYGRIFDVRDGRLIRLPLSAESSPKYRYYARQSAIQAFPGYQTLIKYSHLMNLIRRRWARMEFQRNFQESEQVDPGSEEQAQRLTEMLLERWAEMARYNDVRPVLLLLPSWDQIYSGRDDVNDARVDRVIDLARRLKVPAIDARPALREAARGPEPVFYPQDRHLTVKGHRAVSDYLYRALSAQGLVP